MERSRIVQVGAFVLLIAVITSLRFGEITESCLWFDEMFSVHVAMQPWSSLPSFVALDLIHPPLFYVILKLWITVGGDSLWWLRVLPLVFFLAATVPLALLLIELKQHFRVTAITYIFLIFSGTLLKYSLEVRMYSLLPLLALFSMWLFVRFANEGTSFIALLFVNILLVYTHYFGWFVVASEFAAVLIIDRKRTAKMLNIVAATILAFLPWAVTIWTAADRGQGLSQNIGWMSRPGLREVSILLLNLVEPFYYQTSSNQPVSVSWITIPLLSIITAMVALTLTNWNRIEQKTQKTIKLLGVFILLPLMAAFTVSWLSPYSIWGTRHLVIIFIPFYVLVAIVFFALPNRNLKISIATVVLSLFAAAAVIQFNRDAPRYAWCELKPLTADISNSTVPLYAVEDLIAYHLWFQRQNDLSKSPVIRLDNVDGVVDDKAYFLPRSFNEVKRVDLTNLNEEKMWLVHRATVLRESEPPLRNLIVKGYKITARKVLDAGGESVGLYLLER